MSQAKWLQIGFFLYLVGEAKELFSSYPVQHSGLESHEMCDNHILLYQQISKSKTTYNINVAHYFFRPPRVHCVYYSIEAHCVVYSQQSTHIRMYQEQINMIFYFINQEYLSKHFMIKTCVFLSFWSKKRLASLHSKKRH